MLTTAKYMADKNLEAIRLGEEVMFALERSQSRLLDFDILQINLAHNLSQILRSENRYQEALTYAKKAEELSLQGTEQFMLPRLFTKSLEKAAETVMKSTTDYNEK